jgi:ribosome recycling factor
MQMPLFETELNACLTHLDEELNQIRTGRANPELLASIRVEAYGTMNPIKNVANISVADAKSLLVQPWDKTILPAVLKALSTSELGVMPSQEGDYIRVKLPDLTEERRREFVKLMKERVEHARMAVRNVRQKFMKEIETKVEGGVSEDEGKREKEEVEKRVKEMNEKIEVVREAKEKDLMTV